MGMLGKLLLSYGIGVRVEGGIKYLGCCLWRVGAEAVWWEMSRGWIYIYIYMYTFGCVAGRCFEVLWSVMRCRFGIKDLWAKEFLHF